jgi:putative transposase
MPDYRRYRIPGDTYFFTVNLLERHPSGLLIRTIDGLRQAIRETRKRWPFHIDSWVVLPDHWHCIWILPEGDNDNSKRWRVIKLTFSKALPMTERHSAVRVARGERGIWQSFRILLTLLTYIPVGNGVFGST